MIMRICAMIYYLKCAGGARCSNGRKSSWVRTPLALNVCCCCVMYISSLLYVSGLAVSIKRSAGWSGERSSDPPAIFYSTLNFNNIVYSEYFTYTYELHYTIEGSSQPDHLLLEIICICSPNYSYWLSVFCYSVKDIVFHFKIFCKCLSNIGIFHIVPSSDSLCEFLPLFELLFQPSVGCILHSSFFVLICFECFCFNGYHLAKSYYIYLD
uniref:Secreted protein n=1 Tax=Heterorhabditis bacteriophora TaxID=37862 RepID=A0A1I7WA19_HETBA